MSMPEAVKAGSVSSTSPTSRGVRSNIQQVTAGVSSNSWVKSQKPESPKRNGGDSNTASPVRPGSFQGRHVRDTKPQASRNSDDVLDSPQRATPRPPVITRTGGSFRRSPTGRTLLSSSHVRDVSPEARLESKAQANSGDTFRRSGPPLRNRQESSFDENLSPGTPPARPSSKDSWIKANQSFTGKNEVKSPESRITITLARSTSNSSSSSVSPVRSPSRRFLIDSPKRQSSVGSNVSPGAVSRRPSVLQSSPSSIRGSASVLVESPKRTQTSSFSRGPSVASRISSTGSAGGANVSRTASRTSSFGVEGLQALDSPKRAPSMSSPEGIRVQAEPWHASLGEVPTRFQARRKSSVFTRNVSGDAADLLRMAETMRSADASPEDKLQGTSSSNEFLDHEKVPTKDDSQVAIKWGFFSRMLLLSTNPFLVPGSDFPELTFHDIKLEDLDEIDAVNTMSFGRDQPVCNKEAAEKQNVSKLAENVLKFTQEGPFRMAIMSEWSDNMKECRKELFSSKKRNSVPAKRPESDLSNLEEDFVEVRTIFGVTKLRPKGTNALGIECS